MISAALHKAWDQELSLGGAHLGGLHLQLANVHALLPYRASIALQSKPWLKAHGSQCMSAMGATGDAAEAAAATATGTLMFEVEQLDGEKCEELDAGQLEVGDWARALFRKADVDHSGAVSVAELRAMFAQHKGDMAKYGLWEQVR